MTTSKPPQPGAQAHWVMVRPEPPGQFTARVAGLPGVAATADSREEALERVHDLLSCLLAGGELVALELGPANPLLQRFGRIDPNDPHERAYQEELARFRQEDLERTIRECDQVCSNSSSTPTT